MSPTSPQHVITPAKVSQPLSLVKKDYSMDYFVRWEVGTTTILAMLAFKCLFCHLFHGANISQQTNRGQSLPSPTCSDFANFNL